LGIIKQQTSLGGYHLVASVPASPGAGGSRRSRLARAHAGGEAGLLSAQRWATDASPGSVGGAAWRMGLGPLCFANFWGAGMERIEWDWGFSGIWDLKGCNKPNYSQQQIRFEWNITRDIVGISPDLFGIVIKLCYLVAHPSWQVDNS